MKRRPPETRQSSQKWRESPVKSNKMDALRQWGGRADLTYSWFLGVVTLRKIAMHPTTSVMVVEALKELDSRKGVSKPAIQNFIKRKYPSVDNIRLKYFVRRALTKGLEDGTLVRPPNSTVTTGVAGKFRVKSGTLFFATFSWVAILWLKNLTPHRLTNVQYNYKCRNNDWDLRHRARSLFFWINDTRWRFNFCHLVVNHRISFGWHYVADINWSTKTF